MTNIPKWKIWLSYIFEMQLESVASEHNPVLTLCLSNGRLQLYTDNAIYSYEDLYDNFLEAFKRLDLSKKPFQNVLVLGFGLGSVPFILEKVFGVQANYTGIEIDEEIIRLASEYALPKIVSHCTLISTDAYSYVDIIEEKFDMIIVDVFLDNIIPSRIESAYFLENVRDLLAADGLLLYNRLTTTASDKEKHKEFFENTFSSIFREAIEVEVEDNTILLNSPIYLASKR